MIKFKSLLLALVACAPLCADVASAAPSTTMSPASSAPMAASNKGTGCQDDKQGDTCTTQKAKRKGFFHRLFGRNKSTTADTEEVMDDGSSKDGDSGKDGGDKGTVSTTVKG